MGNATTEDSSEIRDLDFIPLLVSMVKKDIFEQVK